MKASELMDKLFSIAGERRSDGGVDRCIVGEPGKEIKNVAVCCIASPEIIRKAASDGADLLITHEPTLECHTDKYEPGDILAERKEELIRSTGMTVFRFHDNIHAIRPDMINAGELASLGWKGSYDDNTDFTLDQPMKLIEIAKDIEEKLRIKHVRIVGDRDLRVKNISLSTGARGLEAVVRNDRYDLIIAGEIVEWRDAEYIRDASQMGMKKSMIVVGHIGSERDGMKYLADRLTAEYPALTIRYYESEEVFYYTDTVCE